MLRAQEQQKRMSLLPSERTARQGRTRSWDLEMIPPREADDYRSRDATYSAMNAGRISRARRLPMAPFVMIAMPTPRSG